MGLVKRISPFVCDRERVAASACRSFGSVDKTSVLNLKVARSILARSAALNIQTKASTEELVFDQIIYNMELVRS